MTALKKLAVLALLVFSALLSGCLNGGGDEPTPAATQAATQKPTQPGLKSEDDLREEFDCDYGTELKYSNGEVAVWGCLREAAGAVLDEYFYEVGAHPIGSWVVTYIIHDGTRYSEVKKAEELKKFFVPLENEEDALAFVYLSKGLNKVGTVEEAPSAGSTNAQKIENGFTATVLHADWEMCPCYGTYWKSVYDVTEEGEITEKSSEEVYSYESYDCLC